MSNPTKLVGHVHFTIDLDDDDAFDQAVAMVTAYLGAVEYIDGVTTNAVTLFGAPGESPDCGDAPLAN